METYSAIGTVCVLLCVVVFALMTFRNKFPMKVNCWFCQTDATVPYGKQNSWYCLQNSCQQYNGFRKDGDYNQLIMAQYDSHMNKPGFCRPDVFFGDSNGLCEACNSDQHVKTRMLAEFEPYTEDNYDAALDSYKENLEKMFQLCNRCQKYVENKVMAQDITLMKRWRNFLNSSAYSVSSAFEKKSDAKEFSAVNVLDVATAVMVLLLLVLYSYSMWSAFVLKHLFFKPLSALLDALASRDDVITFIGLFLCLVSKIRIIHRLCYLDALSSLLWLLQVLLSTVLMSHIPDLLTWQVACAVTNSFISISCCRARELESASSVLSRSASEGSLSLTPETLSRNGRSSSFLSIPTTLGKRKSSSLSSLFSPVTDTRITQFVPTKTPEFLHSPELLRNRADGSLGFDFNNIYISSPLTRKRKSDLFSSSSSLNSLHSASSSLVSTRPIISPAKLNFVQFQTAQDTAKYTSLKMSLFAMTATVIGLGTGAAVWRNTSEFSVKTFWDYFEIFVWVPSKYLQNSWLNNTQ